MWAASYSLDNLSLMALTIAVGFVVDDAIVVLENITRHVEEGERPFEAALKGAGEIGFTVVSISLSLIAVLIPLLLMSGIIGRLFREFAVTLAMTIVISAFVSLTLTPMMASRFLKPHAPEKHGRLYQLSERGFAAMANGYERGLDIVLRHRFITLMVFVATLGATGYLFVVIPKGFFPQQDTGIVYGNSDAPQDISFARDVEDPGTARRHRSGRSRRRDGGDGAGSRRRRHGAEQRPHVHHPQAARRARRRRLPDHHAAPAPTRQGRGREALSPGRAGRDGRRALRAHPVSVHAAGRQHRRTQHMGAAHSRQASVNCRNCATSRPTSRPPARP